MTGRELLKELQEVDDDVLNLKLCVHVKCRLSKEVTFSIDKSIRLIRQNVDYDHKEWYFETND